MASAKEVVVRIINGTQKGDKTMKRTLALAMALMGMAAVVFATSALIGA